MQPESGKNRNFMNFQRARYPFIAIVLILTLLVTHFPTSRGVAGKAQRMQAAIRQVRVIDSDRSGLKRPVGLAFSSKSQAFQVVEAQGSAQAGVDQTDVTRLNAFSKRAGISRVMAGMKDPINITYDGFSQRLLLLQAADTHLIAVQEMQDGSLNPTTLTRYHIRSLRLLDPQGMAVDPASGVLYILDAAGPRIVRVTPAVDGSFKDAIALNLDLGPVGITNARGLALDPTTGHLFVVSVGEPTLYELEQGGELISTRSLSEFALHNPQAMLFAPTGDQTDDPARMSLFLADSGAPDIRLTDAVAAGEFTQGVGQIVELSFSPAPMSSSIAFQSTVIHKIDTSTLAPPSLDPSGLTYLPSTNRLLMSDGEIEEVVNDSTHFQGANIWEMTLAGEVMGTANISRREPLVITMTNEPTGLAWNANNGFYYVCDDDAQKVYMVDPGDDGVFGTSDDSSNYFSTIVTGNGDPEGITYNYLNDHLFVADGVNMEVYEYTSEGAFVGQFDVERYGVLDPESVEYNPTSNTLFVLSNSVKRIIIETTLSGVLLRTFDVSAANMVSPAGLVYAPSSDPNDNFSIRSFYVVDREIDNNSDPTLMDGSFIEMTAPEPVANGNEVPKVYAGANRLLDFANKPFRMDDASVTDDNLPNPPGSVTTLWSQISGPGLATFADPTAVNTDVDFTLGGAYVLRLAASDGELNPIDDVTITVIGYNTTATLDIPISAGSDDAEEEMTSTSVSLTSTDVDFFTDSGANRVNGIVGLRFNGIDIPQFGKILNAYVKFHVDEITIEPTLVTIHGQADDNASTFRNFDQLTGKSIKADLSTRPVTTASVSWSPPPWLFVNEAGYDQRTTNLTPIIQEIVNRPGWSRGNSLALLFTGSGQRVARSYESGLSLAPVLHLEYESGAFVNTAPELLVNRPIHKSMANQGDAVILKATANDPQDGDISSSILWTSNLDGSLGVGASVVHSDLSLGEHIITVSVTDTNPTEPLTTTSTIKLTILENANVLVGAGDIADCASDEDEQTAWLLDSIRGVVYTVGDSAYQNGTETEFENCYNPSWGRHVARTRPAPGHVDYIMTGAAPYYSYFGANAGESSQGYYSYDLAGWHILALNSEMPSEPGSAQDLWLRDDLASHPATCILAYWHQPLFSSGGSYGGISAMQPLWKTLYSYNVDVVINGQEENYERFAPQDPKGRLDLTRGIRQFVVGTGGAAHSPFGIIQPHSEARSDDTFGVLKLTLNEGGYDWAFIPSGSGTFTDSGSGVCSPLTRFPIGYSYLPMMLRK